MDKHAPIKRKEITIDRNTSWYNHSIADAKSERPKAERKWRKSRLIVHYEIYVNVREKVNNLIDQAKKNYYKDKIDGAHDQKSLFKIVNDLLHRSKN